MDLLEPEDIDDGDLGWRAVLGGTLVLAVVLGALALLGLWVVSLVDEPIGLRTPDGSGEITVVGGEEPAVLADRGRILSTDCVLFGPVDVRPDGSGAYVIVDGANEVACPQVEADEGMTLRWPADSPPRRAPDP